MQLALQHRCVGGNVFSFQAAATGVSVSQESVASQMLLGGLSQVWSWPRELPEPPGALTHCHGITGATLFCVPQPPPPVWS